MLVCGALIAKLKKKKWVYIVIPVLLKHHQSLRRTNGMGVVLQILFSYLLAAQKVKKTTMALDIYRTR